MKRTSGSMATSTNKTAAFGELWFQQDGATCHTARATIDLLKDTFGDHLISRFGPVNWPPRSCDLTPLDYFLWGYVKSLVCADKPQTLDHLEDNIRRVIADIRPQMLEKVIENWTSRLDYIRASRGSPMPEIIFKIVTAEIRERFRQLQNQAQKYAFLRIEVILSMDELNLDQVPQDINKEFQLKRVRLQAIAAATDPGCKKELIRCGSQDLLKNIIESKL
ncbi:putative transposable element [Trichonephila clavipes]|nr:putative transposable element [Trichonephila clavipes]